MKSSPNDGDKSLKENVWRLENFITRGREYFRLRSGSGKDRKLKYIGKKERAIHKFPELFGDNLVSK